MTLKKFKSDQFERVLRDAVRATCGSSKYTSLLIAVALYNSVDSRFTTIDTRVPDLILSESCINWIHDYAITKLDSMASDIIKSYWSKFVETDYKIYLDTSSRLKHQANGDNGIVQQYIGRDSLWFIVTAAFKYCVEENDRKFHHDEKAEMEFYEYLDFIIWCRFWLEKKWVNRLLDIFVNINTIHQKNYNELKEFLQDYLISFD